MLIKTCMQQAWNTLLTGLSKYSYSAQCFLNVLHMSVLETCTRVTDTCMLVLEQCASIVNYLQLHAWLVIFMELAVACEK